MTGRSWDLVAGPYDLLQRLLEPRVLRGTRRWVAGRAVGCTLEVAVGSGLTVRHYPPGVRLTAVDPSAGMLTLARRRARRLGRDADLRTGRAEQLPWPDATFDTVVSVFGLCVVTDLHRALGEMRRVLRPGGLLLLADHVVSTSPGLRRLQAALDGTRRFSPVPGEHWRRRPLPVVAGLGFAVEEHERFLAGVVERLAARRPISSSATARGGGG